VGAKELTLTKAELASRQDRHRGRHPCAAWLVDPVRRLGLLIIDEEQHFGVKHKERLKELRATSTC
jgi:transcription-repair coupling factor (superfamily II helicase)